MPRTDPATLEREWREALRGLLGEELEQASQFIVMGRGWYILRWAHHIPDGGIWCHVGPSDPQVRAKDVYAQIDELKRQAAFKEAK